MQHHIQTCDGSSSEQWAALDFHAGDGSSGQRLASLTLHAHRDRRRVWSIVDKYHVGS